METLWRIVQSMQRAAADAGVEFVTGDTKLVDRGKGDQVYINTAGIGIVGASGSIGPHAVRPGDAVLVSGDLGRHGMAIMAVRENLSFDAIIRKRLRSACRARKRRPLRRIRSAGRGRTRGRSPAARPTVRGCADYRLDQP